METKSLLLNTLFLLLLALCLSACSTSRHGTRFLQKNLKAEIENAPVFQKAFTGFHLQDAQTGEILCAVNADRYFTPASNTKILTLATCLAVLGDSIPRLRYVYAGPDSSEPLGLYIWTSTGDPTTLHPAFQAWQQDQRAFREHPHAPAYFLPSEGSKNLKRFGPGWMWDDFSDYYSPELSAAPVYGNMMRLCWDGTKWTAWPDSFQKHIQIHDRFQRIKRRAFDPVIEVPLYNNFDRDTCFDIPIHNPGLTTHQFLTNTMWRIPGGIMDGQMEIPLEELPFSWYATPVDTVYRRLMHQSDNFIAEQLLVVCSSVKFDTLPQSKLISWAKDSLFAGLPDPPRWVDGSGLSRYNLISPRFLTSLLRKIYQEQPKARLFSLFPAGGISGTIQNWYGHPENAGPYVFAKTGSMSGVHCLSGYLIAKSGRVLIFSFMHNNFIENNTAWKLEMQRLLRLIWLEA